MLTQGWRERVGRWFDVAHSNIFRSAEQLSRARQHCDQFFDLVALSLFVAACDCMLDAVPDVIVEDFALDLLQRRCNRLDLRDDVDAVSVIFHHLDHAADLTLDALEAGLTDFLRVLFHVLINTPWGYKLQAETLIGNAP